MLYTKPVSEDMTVLPSPESLKRKVIVKAKKQAPAEKEIESESEEEEEAGKIAVDMKANIQEVPYKIILESEVLLYFVYRKGRVLLHCWFLLVSHLRRL